MTAMLAKLLKKPRDRLGITYFGLLGHEIAVLRTVLENAPDFAADYELREPNDAYDCDIVVVNQDSQTAASWWKNIKAQNPAAVPMFLTDSKEAGDERVYCKRPFSPSFLQAAFQDVVSKNLPAA